MENAPNSASADWRQQVRMLIGAAFGFVTAVFVGVASADETQVSVPVQPDVALAPAVVVSAGASAINVNAVTRLSALSETRTEYGTAVQLDDGRIGTVAHALVDARSVGIGSSEQARFGPLRGSDAIAHSIDEVHDLASFRLASSLESMSIAEAEVMVGEQVALAGYGKDERLTVLSGEVVYVGPGAAYGIARPEIIVIGAPVEAGWSGGPVANSEGELLALIVGVEQVSGVAIAVPIEHLPEVDL